MKADEAGIEISGRRWSASDFVRADGTPGPWTSKALEADPLSFEAELGRFLTEFFSPGAAVTVHTSGSTGAPKAFAAEKSRMRASARATIAFLGLKPGCTNLLAMPLRFIAGKMVVVRSVECGLNLIPVEPCANPFLEHREAVDLCALTPMQAVTVLANPATSRFLLESRAVILGGGPVDEELTAKLQSAQGAVYASYGMTETLSHVALRRLNGPTADAGFRALPGVTISLSALNTLQIEAPAVAAQTLITHDRARFNPDGTFSLIGRLDNVINTGAVKIQIEEVEAKLKPFISGRFAVSARKSRLFGEEVVLVLEGSPALLSALDFSHMRQALGRFERPHWVVCTSELPLTGSGKPDRPAIRKAAETLFAEPWTALEAGAASNIIGSRRGSFSTDKTPAVSARTRFPAPMPARKALVRRSHLYRINTDPTAQTLIRSDAKEGSDERLWTYALDKKGHAYVDIVWSCGRATPGDYTLSGDAQGCHSPATSTLDEGLRYGSQQAIYGEIQKWQEPVKAKFAEIEKGLERIKQLLEVTKLTPEELAEVHLMLDKAQEIYDQVKKDGSWGVHAPRYLLDRVTSGAAYIVRAQAIVDNGGYQTAADKRAAEKKAAK